MRKIKSLKRAERIRRIATRFSPGARTGSAPLQRDRETARARRQTLAAFVPSKFAPGHRDRRSEAAARKAAVSWGEAPFLEENSPFGNPD
ncbi:hypothetical protein [Mesorhizobium sp. WSM4904]|uniref:hypothetical protein n=1 Tax=Mesorhizobium sp. WSM4904 TaxID=3038545 RepID=UPI002418286E|nr:hypothetical protein [Mesorhizobium sp. WSM4904]WFP63850.1 hypothetical protein QAZ47_04515 [Mesorhizobium sp. WSM4904]